MNRVALPALVLLVFAGCVSQPSLVDSSVQVPGPVVADARDADPDVLQRAYEQRVRHRTDELYRTRQEKSYADAEKRARRELEDRYVSSASDEPAHSRWAASRPPKPAMNKKALDAAAEEVSRQRSQ